MDENYKNMLVATAVIFAMGLFFALIGCIGLFFDLKSLALLGFMVGGITAVSAVALLLAGAAEEGDPFSTTHPILSFFWRSASKIISAVVMMAFIAIGLSVLAASGCQQDLGRWQ
jgi:hypothetical protein